MAPDAQWGRVQAEPGWWELVPPLRWEKWRLM